MHTSSTGSDALSDVLGILDHVVFRYVITSPTDYRYEFFSEASSRVWGYSPHELMADPRLWYSRVEESDRQAVIDPALGQLVSGQPIAVEYRFRRADGEVRAMRTRLVPRAGDGQTLVVTGVAWDVTETNHQLELSRYTEDQLRRAERTAAVGLASSQLAHELRNPLTYLVLNLESLRDELGRAQGTQGLLPRVEECLHGADRMMAIIEEFRRAVRGQASAETCVDMASVCRQAARMVDDVVRPAATLTLALTQVRPVKASATKLGQVVVNLLTNAAQAIGEGHPERNRIVLTLDERDGWVTLTVADSGPGVPAHLEPLIFAPMFSTKGPTGQGLGLAISRGFVVEAGGSIHVGRCAELGGAELTVRLPVAEQGTRSR